MMKKRTIYISAAVISCLALITIGCVVYFAESAQTLVNPPGYQAPTFEMKTSRDFGIPDGKRVMYGYLDRKRVWWMLTDTDGELETDPCKSGYILDDASIKFIQDIELYEVRIDDLYLLMMPGDMPIPTADDSFVYQYPENTERHGLLRPGLNYTLRRIDGCQIEPIDRQALDAFAAARKGGQQSRRVAIKPFFKTAAIADFVRKSFGDDSIKDLYHRLASHIHIPYKLKGFQLGQQLHDVEISCIDYLIWDSILSGLQSSSYRLYEVPDTLIARNQCSSYGIRSKDYSAGQELDLSFLFRGKDGGQMKGGPFIYKVYYVLVGQKDDGNCVYRTCPVEQLEDDKESLVTYISLKRCHHPTPKDPSST